MRTISVETRKKIQARDDTWVEKARELVHGLENKDKERQLRNIQSIAETSESWKAVELFIRYQAARKELDKRWAEESITNLGTLQSKARELAGKDDPKVVHMELVARVLGYAVRWHVWDTKGEKNA